MEDDEAVRRLVVRVLDDAGYAVDEAQDGLAAMERLGANRPDLVLLDVMLPNVDGFELLPRLRETYDVPIILLTALASEGERIRGLQLGADDYIVKPFSPGELVARIESVLRRSRVAVTSQDAPAEKGVLRYGDLEVDRKSREVRVNEEVVALTTKEFDLLAFFAASPRQVFSREQLLRQVWASEPGWQDEATVTEHVRRIRRKVEVDPDEPRWITTVRGAGYRFEP